MELFSLIYFTFCIFTVIVVPLADGQRGVAPRFYDVRNYGAVADGKTDNSKSVAMVMLLVVVANEALAICIAHAASVKMRFFNPILWKNCTAFLRAWNEACHSEGKSRVFIPKGIYMLNPLRFQGKCNGEIGVLIKGTLKAPTDPNNFYIQDSWIDFYDVDGLVVSGGGYLDGQGFSAWPYNDCFTNPHCKTLPVTMSFSFVKNARVHHLRSIDSKNTHFNLFKCNNMEMKYIRISAPSNSPNTDGIRIGRSNNIRISRTVIGTGDDCISMLEGTQNIDISEVECGPGHGISIGSLGRTFGEDPVIGVTVRKCTFRGTQNGVRIKTWAKLFPTFAENFVFEDIQMENVNNPIIIDQQYCPQGNCGVKVFSTVQIRNVTFENIHGSSSSKDALILKCSALFPCRDVKLENINLSYYGKGGPATSSCINARGKSYGIQHPSGCL